MQRLAPNDNHQFMNALREQGIASSQELLSLEEMSPNKRKRVLVEIAKLQERQLLNAESFREAVARVSVPLPPVKEAAANVKESESGFDRMVNIKDGPSFTYLRTLEFDFDGDLIPTQVFKGYKLDDKTRIEFCVKESLKQNISAASKAAKYSEFVYGFGLWFRHKNTTIALNPWQHGEVLNPETNENIDFSAYDPKRRIKWLLSGLRKLRMLHLRKRLHADIKPDNFVLCIEEDDLKVIDFDSAHKAYTRRSYSSCIAFSDNEPTQRDIIPYDMYTYSFIIAVLFPELFKIEKVRQVTEHGVFTRFIIQKITPPEINAYHQAVLNLFDAIYIQEAAMRCTSKDAIDFCELVLACDSLQPDSLADITQRILFREDLTVDDVLCDSERPLLLRK